MDEVLFVIGLSSATLLLVFGTALAYKIWNADPTEYQSNRERCAGFFGTLRGECQPIGDGSRDFREMAGVAKTVGPEPEWVECGRLSDEAIDSILTNK